MEKQISFFWNGLETQKTTAISYPIVVPLAPQIGCQFQFVRANARPHIARVVRAFFKDHDIEDSPWLAQSPDLNPTEHI